MTELVAAGVLCVAAAVMGGLLGIAALDALAPRWPIVAWREAMWWKWMGSTVAAVAVAGCVVVFA